MGIFDKLFKKRKFKNPEEDFVITITDKLIRVEHPNRKAEHVSWNNIQEIKLINTDSGPLLPDIWLALIGEEDGCLIPHGAKGFDEIYDIVSKYEGFNFEEAIKSFTTAGNAEFHLWTRKSS
jgi:hypothetical protein